MIIFNKYISTSDVKAIGILTIFLLIAEKVDYKNMIFPFR